MPSLGVGGSDTEIRTVTFPAFMSPGAYYVGMIVEAGDNENNFADNDDYDPNRVTLSSNCPVDFDGNGLYDLTDVIEFVTRFSNNDPSVDFDNNNLWDLNDIVTFVQLFQAGCP
jgi:hypothetical protein